MNETTRGEIHQLAQLLGIQRHAWQKRDYYQDCESTTSRAAQG